jgi:hypothetical protein
MCGYIIPKTEHLLPNRYDGRTCSKVCGGTGGSWRIGSNALVKEASGNSYAVRFCSFFSIPVDVPGGDEVHLQFAHIRMWSQRASHPHIGSSGVLQVYNYPPAGDRIIALDGSHVFQQLEMAPAVYKVPKRLRGGQPSLCNFVNRTDPTVMVGVHSTSEAAENVLRQLSPACLLQKRNHFEAAVPADWHDMLQ